MKLQQYSIGSAVQTSKYWVLYLYTQTPKRFGSPPTLLVGGEAGLLPASLTMASATITVKASHRINVVATFTTEGIFSEMSRLPYKPAGILSW